MLSEKFQMTVPFKKSQENGGNEWATPEHVHEGVTPSGEKNKFNKMPPGYDATSERDQFTQGFGGNTDVSGDVEPSSMGKGYKRLEMSPTDELYTGEQVDLFYGDAVDENGKVGFAERNNYLDRI